MEGGSQVEGGRKGVREGRGQESRDQKTQREKPERRKNEGWGAGRERKGTGREEK